MAIVTRCDSAWQKNTEELPLECELNRPPIFEAYSICGGKRFSNEIVLYPRGMETLRSNHSQRSAQTLAPYPGNTNLLRQTYNAYIAANGISHLDQRQHPHMDGSVIAHGVYCELKHHIELLSNSLTPPRLKSGPHRSQQSRGVAVTLLLPSGTSDKCKMVLLDAFAQMAQTPVTKAATSSLLDSAVPKVWPSSTNELSCTQIVRLSVVAGTDDVAAYMKRMQVQLKDKNTQWTTNSAICVSYIVCKEAKTVYITLELTSEPKIADAVNAIMQCIIAVQIQSSGVLTLPPGLIAPDTIPLDEPGLTEPRPFIELQAKLQQRFKHMHLCKPFVEIPKQVLPTLLTQNREYKFVRVCSNAQPWKEEDPRHSIGILYTSDDQILNYYLRRCRAEVPRQWPMTKWPPYVLLPPEGDELAANICVLWFKCETVHIGGDLNLFGCRCRQGVPACDLQDCHTSRIIPNLASIERLGTAGYFVVPCTGQSVLPHYSPSTNYTPFHSFLMETEQDVIEPVCLTSSPIDQSRTLHAISDPSSDDKLYSSLLASHAGHPCSTLGQVYAVLQEHASKQSLESMAFHTLLSVGMLRFGEAFAVEELMRVSADLIQNAGIDGSVDGIATQGKNHTQIMVDKKRPNEAHNAILEVEMDSKQTTKHQKSSHPTRDPLTEHLNEDNGRTRILELAGMKSINYPGNDDETQCDNKFQIDIPLQYYGVIETIWILLGFADSDPDEAIMQTLIQSTDVFLAQTFQLKVGLSSIDDISWHCAAIQACLKVKHSSELKMTASKKNKTFIVVSRGAHPTLKNKTYTFVCNMDGTNGVLSECQILDLIACTDCTAQKRNLVWLEYKEDDYVTISCYTSDV